MSYLNEQDAEFLRWQVEKGGPTSDEYEEVQAVFHRMGDTVREGRASRPEINAEFRRLISPLLAKPDNMMAKAVLRPYGYAGDFEIIDNIYTYWHSDNPLFIRWDEFAHWQTAVQAVRNRKAYFIERLREFGDQASGARYSVLDVGSGPGRDISEYLGSYQGDNVEFDCVDMDPRAIDYAKELCRGYETQIEFYCSNIFHYRASREYDLIWSGGLFDYLTDDQFVLLLKQLRSMCKAEGKMILGNFSIDNPTRDFMEAGDWYLHYRTEDDLIRLALASGVEQDSVRVEQEAAGVNLFLVIEGN